MSEEDLAAIEARANAATPGPWDDCIFAEGYATASDERGVHWPQAEETYQKSDGTWHTVHICRGMTGPNRVENAIFIAAARSDVPALIAEVRRLRGAGNDAPCPRCGEPLFCPHCGLGSGT